MLAKDRTARPPSASRSADALAALATRSEAGERGTCYRHIPPVPPVPVKHARWLAVAAAGILAASLLTLGIYLAANGLFDPPDVTPPTKGKGSKSTLPPSNRPDVTPPTKGKVIMPSLPSFDVKERAKKQQTDWAARLQLPVEVTNKVGMKLMLIPPAGEVLPQAYYLGKYEI